MIKAHTAKKFARFIGVSGLSAVVTFGVPILLHEGFRIDERISIAVGYLVAVFVNYFYLVLFVFPGTRNANSAVGFLVSAVIFRTCEYGLFILLFVAVGIHYLIALLITQTIGTVIRFFVFDKIVFKSKHSIVLSEAKTGKQS